MRCDITKMLSDIIGITFEQKGLKNALELTDSVGWFRSAVALVSSLSCYCRGLVRGDLVLLILIVCNLVEITMAI